MSRPRLRKCWKSPRVRWWISAGAPPGFLFIHDGQAIYTADEATGGTHLDLVLAGNYKIDVDEAERIKTDPARQREIFPLVRPVFQKMASIVNQHLRGHSVSTLYLVGGTSCFPGIQEVMEEETGLPVALPVNPLLVTPLGIALSCVNNSKALTAPELGARRIGRPNPQTSSGSNGRNGNSSQSS